MTPGDLLISIYDLGLSRSDLAEIAGVDARTVRRWLAGAHAIPETMSAIFEDLYTYQTRMIESLDGIDNAHVLLYRTNEDIRAFTDDKFAGFHTMTIVRADAELIPIVFDARQYSAWLGTRKNTPGTRAQWAATQA